MNQSDTPSKVGSSDQLGLVPERWYCVSKDGLATLCASKRDALDSVASQNVSWPHSAPHRAVLMGDVAEERERCARIVERINGWIGTREVAAEIRGETQILRA